MRISKSGPVIVYGTFEALPPADTLPGSPYVYVFNVEYDHVKTLLARAREALDKIGSIDPRDVEFIRKVREEL